jgi:hypothetical protein
MSEKSEPVVINLEVARVGHGGNTGAGKYFYNFFPDIVNVSGGDTLMSYRLSADTDRDFRFRRFFSTDALGQLSKPRILDDGRRLDVMNANTAEYLILVSIQVEDLRDGTLINCDPQVTNVPET